MAGIQEVPNTGTRHNIFPKFQVTFGPWPAGLNTTEDPSLLPGNALQECVNYMILDDGRLKMRPYATYESPLPAVTSNPANYFDYQVYWRALGTIMNNINTKRVPVIALTGAATHVGIAGPGTDYYSRFYYWNGSAWSKAFDNLGPGDLAGLQNFNPIQILGYNDLYWVLFNREGFSTCATLTGALDVADGPPELEASGGTDLTYIRKALVLKDRILIMSGANIYWSDSNPSGVANDWSSVAPHTAGNLGLQRELFNEQLNDMIVYNNNIYIASSTKVSRLSWTVDPGVDGTYTVVTDKIGGEKFATYNGQLYLFNRMGLYRLVNNYFIEVSEPVRTFFKGQGTTRGLDQFNTNFTIGADSNGISRVPDYAVSMYQMENLLLIGPINKNAAVRSVSETLDSYTGNLYLVYNLDNGNWTKWQFSPNDPSPYPIAGPMQDLVAYSPGTPSTVSRYFWVGQHLNAGSLDATSYRPQSIFMMDPSLLSGDETSNLRSSDEGPVVSGQPKFKYIGGIIKTAESNLGDGNSWKRVLTALVEADPWHDPGVFSGINPNMGLLLGDSPTNKTPTKQQVAGVGSTGRLRMGGPYRTRRVGFYYDALTDITPIYNFDHQVALDRVIHMSVFLTLGRKEPTAINN